MSKLVEELKNEHVQITEALNRASTLGVTSPEGQTALVAARDILLAHLKKEDEQFYPLLHNAAVSDPALKRVLFRFATDMDGISKAAGKFFDKHSAGAAGIEFARDFGRLCAQLSDRIGREENILYKKYDELATTR